jgi:sugar lactone lactonase YvrE
MATVRPGTYPASFSPCKKASPDGRAGSAHLLPRGAEADQRVFGGPDRKTRYITEAGSGAVQCAELDVPGVLMYSHAG